MQKSSALFLLTACLGVATSGCFFSKNIPLIHQSIRSGQSITQIERMLNEEKHIIDQTDNYGRTPLYMAALKGDADLVAVLLRHGAKPNIGASWKGGDTALHAASENGNTAVVKVLIEYGVNPNILNSSGQTPLHYASWMKHPETVRFLLANAANVQIRDRGGRTAINGIGVYGRGLQGAYLSVVKFLLSAGLGPDTTEENGTTPLMDACRCGATDVVDFLLHHSAQVNKVNNAGWTALMFAAFGGYRDIMELLLANGADKRKVNSDGKTAEQLLPTGKSGSHIKESGELDM